MQIKFQKYQKYVVSIMSPKTMRTIKAICGGFTYLSLIACSIFIPNFFYVFGGISLGIMIVFSCIYAMVKFVDNCCDSFFDFFKFMVIEFFLIPVIIFNFFFCGFYKKNKIFYDIINLLQTRTYEFSNSEWNNICQFNFGDKTITITNHNIKIINNSNNKELAEVGITDGQKAFFEYINTKIKRIFENNRNEKTINNFKDELNKIVNPAMDSSWDENKEKEILNRIQQVLLSGDASQEFKESFSSMANAMQKDLTSTE